MISNRIHPAQQAAGLGELFEPESRPAAKSGVESIEEFLAMLLALQEGGARGWRRGGSRAHAADTHATTHTRIGARTVHSARPYDQPELVHAESLPARPARYADLAGPLPRALAHVLDAQGISRLYAHQAEAIDLARAGKHVVVATGTASGKSLAYHVPVLERLLLEKEATALYLFPTKALAQDQLRGLNRFAEASH